MKQGTLLIACQSKQAAFVSTLQALLLLAITSTRVDGGCVPSAVESSWRVVDVLVLCCATRVPLQVSQPAILAFQQLVQLLPPARATAASKRAVDRLESQGTDDGTLAAVRLLAHTVRFWTPEALRRHVPRYVSRWAGHRDFSVREVSRSLNHSRYWLACIL